ncbi:hypothetical protein [Flavobacterium sp. UBA7663]|uniref:hypothetical protein n=1 Tax=Flavobacterium sp. UBA7663 TaxID=1946557 RepID=UPI0025BD50B8|nr:hypothetical protein [Flavobacterium sp. UBA7663]
MNNQKSNRAFGVLRKKLIVAFFLVNATCFSQSSIHFDDSSKFPGELTNLKTWLIDFANKTPFRLGSFKVSPNQDAALNIYSLRTNQPKKIEIGNSAIFLEYGTDDKLSRNLSIQHESKWKIKAYNSSFDLNSYKPSNNFEIYENLLWILNISEAQAMAEFLNRYISDDTENKIKKYVEDIEKKYKVNLLISDYDNITLTELTKIIYAKTNQYSSTVGYEIYLKNTDEKKCRNNINLFFRKYTPDPIARFYDIITPEGKFYFTEPKVTLKLSDKDFLFVDELGKMITVSESISFSFKYINYKIEYDSNNEPYLKLHFDNLDCKNQTIYFQIKNEEKLNKKLFEVFPFDKRAILKSTDINDVTFYLYKDKIEARMKKQNKNGSYTEYVFLNKKIRYN